MKDETKVTITLYNQWFILEMGEGERLNLLYDLQDFISYNQTVENWERKNGVKFDWENTGHILKIAWDKYTPTAFSNYLFHLHSGTYYNQRDKVHFPMAYRSDGYVPLERVNKRNNTLAYRVGLLELVLKTFQSEDFKEDYGFIQVTAVDYRENKINWTPQPVYEVGEMILREKDQQKVLNSIRETMSSDTGNIFHTVLVDLAVGFGKTVLMGALVKNIQDANVVFFFRERNLALQAIDDYLEMGFDVGTIIANPKSVDKYLESIGQEKRPKHGVLTGFTIIMAQTLQSRVGKGELTAEDFTGVNGVFVDECEEGYTGDKTQSLFDLFKPGIQVGYSGTPLDSPSKKQRLLTLSLFGSQVYKITVSQNNIAGVTLPANVKFYHNPMPKDLVTTPGGRRKSVGKAKEDGIYKSEVRYQKMKEGLLEALRDGKQAMIYFGHAPLEFGQYLLDRMGQDPDFSPYKTGYVTGDIPVMDRAEIYKSFSKHETRIIIANRVVRRGLNIPEIQVMVNWEATDSKASIVQGIIGRPCRKNGEDVSFMVIDFYDQGHPEIEQLAQTRLKVFGGEDIGANLSYDYINQNGIPLG